MPQYHGVTDIPAFDPGTLPYFLDAYLDDKGIDHFIQPNNYLHHQGKKGLEVNLFQVPAKMLHQVLMPEFINIARPWGKRPKPSFTFRRRGIIKKIKVRF